MTLEVQVGHDTGCSSCMTTGTQTRGRRDGEGGGSTSRALKAAERGEIEFPHNLYDSCIVVVRLRAVFRVEGC